MDDLANLLDPFLIPLYRVTGRAALDYALGTFTLALSCVLLGSLIHRAAARLNRRNISEIEEEMKRGHELSLSAAKAGDKASYEAINKGANEAFGRHFFVMAAHSAAFVLPVPFALAWMQMRFGEVSFSLPWPLSSIAPTTGYFTTFLAAYLAAICAVKGVKRLLRGSRKPA